MTGRSREWDDEAHAAQVLVAILGGRSEGRDPGGGRVPIHDFDLHLDDGSVIAVEVTRHNIEAQLQQQAEVARHDPRFPGLQFHWHLGMGRTFDVKRIRTEAPDLLATLEERGTDSIDLVEATSSDDPTFAGLRSLGVRLVYRLGHADLDGGALDIGAAPIAGATAPDVAVEAAEQCAGRKGKAEKLAAAVADERHLFVWVENSRDQVVATMGMGTLPRRAPELPDAIDAVWLATAYEYPHVWQYERRSGWSEWGTPTR